MKRARSYIICFGICAMLAGCGGSHSEHSSEAGKRNVAVVDKSKVVDSSKAPAALRRTGFHIVLQPGHTPAGFDHAIYGTASNSRGRSVHFGFFFVNDTRASNRYTPSLLKLVPEATDEGTTNGESFIVVTSAGAHGKPNSRSTNEEFRIFGALQWAVAGLARKALEEEGP